MSKRRQIIPQRTPVFLGCEGESEQAYGQLLNDLLRIAGRPVHIEVVTLNPGAGDPLARLRRAEQEITRRQQRRSEFRIKAILMDSDQIANDRPRYQAAEQLARALGIQIIWQEPCHEAVLLRHLQGCTQHRPPRQRDAEIALKRAWPDYDKPMTKSQLSRRIARDAIERVAAVEPSLRAFFRDITLLP
jgi:hypothetical protein